MYVEDILQPSTTRPHWVSRGILGSGYPHETLFSRPSSQEWLYWSFFELDSNIRSFASGRTEYQSPPRGVLALDLGFWGAAISYQSLSIGIFLDLLRFESSKLSAGCDHAPDSNRTCI